MPVELKFNAEPFKPKENGNIQMLLAGPTATLKINSPTPDYVINWGDGITESATGTGNRTYSHTYETDSKYQVEISNCTNIISCNGISTCLKAYWSIGDSNVSELSFSGFSRLAYIGLVFKNDKNRGSFYSCFNSCYSLTSIPTGLFDNCSITVTFGICFNSCYSLMSIPTGLFDNCQEVTTFYRCFESCFLLANIPVGLFDHCKNVTTFSRCFCACTELVSIPTGLFDNCQKVESFDNSFAGCKK